MGRYRSETPKASAFGKVGKRVLKTGRKEGCKAGGMHRSNKRRQTLLLQGWRDGSVEKALTSQV